MGTSTQSRGRRCGTERSSVSKRPAVAISSRRRNSAPGNGTSRSMEWPVYGAPDCRFTARLLHLTQTNHATEKSALTNPESPNGIAVLWLKSEGCYARASYWAEWSDSSKRQGDADQGEICLRHGGFQSGRFGDRQPRLRCRCANASFTPPRGGEDIRVNFSCCHRELIASWFELINFMELIGESMRIGKQPAELA